MKAIACLVLAAGLALGAAGAACAAEEGLSASAELDAVSRYVWRGISLSRKEAYQPSVTVSGYGLTANAWFNYSLDEPRPGKVNEADYTLSYEREAAGFAVTPGFALYSYPGADDYGEAFIKLSRPMGSFRFITEHYLSAVSGDIAGGYYGDAGLGYERRLPGGASWASSALLGWGSAKFNSFSYGTPGLAGRLNVLVLDTAVTFELPRGFSLRPHLTLHATLPGGLRGAARAAGNSPDNLVLGLAAGRGF